MAPKLSERPAFKKCRVGPKGEDEDDGEDVIDHHRRQHDPRLRPQLLRVVVRVQNDHKNHIEGQAQAGSAQDDEGLDHVEQGHGVELQKPETGGMLTKPTAPIFLKFKFDLVVAYLRF